LGSEHAGCGISNFSIGKQGDNMSNAISILHIGVPMDHPSIPSDMRPKVERGLKDIKSEMTRSGFDYRLIYYSPEGGLQGFVEQLRKNPSDGVVIGGGVTSNPQMTGFMEQIVDVTHLNAPKAKIMFIHGPEVDEVHQAVRRWFPST
jgi:hypothetical protein